MFTCLVGFGFTQAKAHAWTGLAPSSRYELLHPGNRRVPNPTPHAQRCHGIAYSEEEKAMIAAQINAEPGSTITQIHTKHLDAGTALASKATYHRIARSALCPTRFHPQPQAMAARPTAMPPQLKASRPYETLVWDITFLPLLARGQSVALHMVLDLYSRSVVGWAVGPYQCASLAATLFDQVITKAAGQGLGVEVIHSDNGSTMKSQALKKVAERYAVKRSFSRPHVSDDNPHMESSFATLKNHASYPGVFEDLEHARAWVEEWVEFYNTHRVHPGLADFTPAQILDGSWEEAWQVRQRNALVLYAANPARYRYRKPVIAKPVLGVSFNLTNTPGDVSNRSTVSAVINTKP